MSERVLTDKQVAQFHKDGYLLMRGYYDEEEIDLLKQIAGR